MKKVTISKKIQEEIITKIKNDPCCSKNHFGIFGPGNDIDKIRQKMDCSDTENNSESCKESDEIFLQNILN